MEFSKLMDPSHHTHMHVTLLGVLNGAQHAIRVCEWCVCGSRTTVETHLIKERVVGALPGAGFFDGVATHHLHDRVQLTAQQLTRLQHMYTHLYTHIHGVSIHMYIPSQKCKM